MCRESSVGRRTHRELGLSVALLRGGGGLGRVQPHAVLATILRPDWRPGTWRGLGGKVPRLLRYPLLSRRGAIARPVPRLAALITRAVGAATVAHRAGSSRGSRFRHGAPFAPVTVTLMCCGFFFKVVCIFFLKIEIPCGIRHVSSISALMNLETLKAYVNWHFPCTGYTKQ